MDKLLERESKAQAVIKQLPQYRYEFETIEMAYCPEKNYDKHNRNQSYQPSI